MKTYSVRSPVVEVVQTTRGFAALEEEWEELYEASPQATPFQSWAWLYSWWESYGEDHDLRLVTVREEGGVLVGILPLMVERGGLRRLLFVGTGLTDYLDVLVTEGWEREVSEVAMRAIERMASWRLVDLQQLRPEAAAWKVFGGWTGFEACAWQDNCPVLEFGSWDELLGSLSKRGRNNVRRTLRRADGDGIRRVLAGGEEAGPAAHRLVALHREEWQGRGIDPEHLTERFEDHLESAARRMTKRGLAVIYELWLDGEVIVSDLLLFGHDFVGDYMGGANQEAFQRYQVTSLCMWNAVDIASGRKSVRLDLGRGEEPYKLSWKPNVVSNHRLILGRNPLSWAPYAGYHILRARARSYVYSEQSPRWVANVVKFLKKSLPSS